ncbi:MAG: hypothetical protein LBR18_01490, partial [Tannerella sp.]|nr:hypothetical protein [Tannerella sp.]
GKSVDGLPYIGVQNEAVCCADANSGMLLTMAEQGDVMGVFVGHDHVNDYIFNDMGIALAYGRFSGSKTTYGYDVMKINGVRVIEMSENQDGIVPHSFDTWIRLADNSVINKVRGPECVAL